MKRTAGRLSRALLAIACFGTTSSASADKVNDISRQLSRHQGEVRRIGQSVRAPSQVGKPKTADAIRRKLVEAQVQFGIRNYDEAAVLLYDLVEGHKTSAVYDEALYYLAESLYLKKDNLASRAYFKRLVDERGTRSKFYQQGLERLVELSLRLSDQGNIESYLSALEALPVGARRASVPYVRGKYAHFRGDFDKAIKFFRQVPRNSKYSFRADYFIGAAQISKNDLGGAARTFTALIRRPAKSKADRRVVELAHMARGRLYYERDQPSKAIDSYLNIGRKSDLFDDVLYEVAWVYVKNKEYPKALRALELLQLTDPKSSRLPEVRILEGNLRIRKAQLLYDNGTGNPVEEYDKALKVFTKTRVEYTQPSQALEELLANEADPARFVGQVTGRQSKTFETDSSLPEVAVAWLREEPEVERLVQVETDLGSIETYIEEANQTIRRLELAIGSDAKVAIFPELAERRYRILDIRSDTEKARATLFRNLTKRAKGKLTAAEAAEAHRLAAERRRLEQSIGELSGEKSATERAKAAKGRFTSVDQQGSELWVKIQGIEAEIVAIERYLATAKKIPDDVDVDKIKQQLADEKAKVAIMRQELEQLRDDALLGREAAGSSADSSREEQLRSQLRQSLDAEAAFWGRVGVKLSNRRKVDQILRLLRTANQIGSESDLVLGRISQVADVALVDVRRAIEDEKAKLSAYQQEFLNYEQESRGIGSEVLGSAFGVVAAKFKDVLMRADVGIVDVSWSHKESNERLRKRLVLDRARERRTLRSDFGDIIQELREAEEELKSPSPAEDSQGGGGQ